MTAEAQPHVPILTSAQSGVELAAGRIAVAPDEGRLRHPKVPVQQRPIQRIWLDDAPFHARQRAALLIDKAKATVGAVCPRRRRQRRQQALGVGGIHQVVGVKQGDAVASGGSNTSVARSGKPGVGLEDGTDAVAIGHQHAAAVIG